MSEPAAAAFRWASGVGILAAWLAVLGLSMLGCSSGDEVAPPAAGEISVTSLQRQLPPGEAPDWYGRRLAELGYEVTAAEYGEDEPIRYSVRQRGRAFVVELELDADSDTASSIRIAAATGARGEEAPAEDTATAAGASADAAGAGADAAASAARTKDEAGATAARQQPRKPSRPPPRALVGLPAGTRIAARVNERLASGAARRGERFTLTVAQAVRAGEIVAIPDGSTIRGTVAAVNGAAGPDDPGRMLLRVDSVRIDGYTFAVDGTVRAPGYAIEADGTLAAEPGAQVNLEPDALLDVELRADATIEVR